MMTIREYFDELSMTQDFDEAWAEEQRVYDLYEDDDEAFDAWAAEHHIDRESEQGHHDIIHWAWDMCGD